MPLFILELSLVSFVIIWDRVDATRLKKNMEDHRGINGRILWVLIIALISNGLATIVACILMMQKSSKAKKQMLFHYKVYPYQH